MQFPLMHFQAFSPYELINRHIFAFSQQVNLDLGFCHIEANPLTINAKKKKKKKVRQHACPIGLPTYDVDMLDNEEEVAKKVEKRMGNV